MSLLRRSFLKIGSVLVAGTPFLKYAEAEELIPEVYKHDWVEDKGGHYIIRVPAYKTFSGEKLDKPCIFLLGEKAEVNSCEVEGFVNVHYKDRGVFRDTYINAKGFLCEGRKSAVHCSGSGTIGGLHVIVPDYKTTGVYLEHS